MTDIDFTKIEENFLKSIKVIPLKKEMATLLQGDLELSTGLVALPEESDRDVIFFPSEPCVLEILLQKPLRLKLLETSKEVSLVQSEIDRHMSSSVVWFFEEDS